jgi:AAA domain, putative AbiEii toxin, Type IV TA system
LFDVYQLKLEDQKTHEPRNPNDLSSGEKVLLQLVLWLYNSKHHNRFPRLFLLDEPDGHLHPSMTRQFMDVIKEVLVEHYKVRVILTTHSPSTVALAPDESIFEMSRDKPRIRPSKSKADTIGLLTAGLVIVSPSSRYVLVEDQADVEFYGAVRDILSDYGPSKDPKALKPSPSVVFLPASLGRGSSKVGGGKSVVVQWVEKFDAPPLDQLVRGIIDLDSGNVPTRRVHVLERYCIENYLLDPFVVYGVLLDEGQTQSMPGTQISRGDEHLVRMMSDQGLQAIVDMIKSKVEPVLFNLTPSEQTGRTVLFTSGKSVQYPVWMIERRGHDLLPTYQSVFGGSLITPPRLYRSLRRVRLVANELAEIMQALQD